MSFEHWLIQHEIIIRTVCFFTILLTMMLWETLNPLRAQRVSRWVRWPNNLGLVFLNSLVVRLLFPAAAVGVAVYGQEHNIGLLHQIPIPLAVSVLFSIVILDLVIYGQHVLVHRVPLLWRFHKVHHADREFDVTTGSRFHPVEIVLSMLIKFFFILLLGIPVVAVVCFEIILNGMAMFNHSNIQLPDSLDKLLRKIIVTPDMHRVHHSQQPEETNSNYGFNLSIWDRIFKTYIRQPDLGHKEMEIGLAEISKPFDTSWLPGILLLPFRKG